MVVIPVGLLLAEEADMNFLAAIPTMGFLAFATLVFTPDLELTDREADGFVAL